MWFQWGLWSWSERSNAAGDCLIAHCASSVLAAPSGESRAQSGRSCRVKANDLSSEMLTQQPGAWWLWAKYPESPADSKNNFISWHGPCRQGLRMHYKRAVHYHIFQKLLMSRKSPSPCTTLMRSKAAGVWTSSVERQAEWLPGLGMQEVQAIGDKFVQFPWEISVLCLIMAFHVHVFLQKLGNSWKYQNAWCKIWALFTLNFNMNLK